MMFDMWTPQMKEMLIASNGSVQNLNIPNYLKLFLKTLMKYTNTGKQLIIFLEKL